MATTVTKTNIASRFAPAKTPILAVWHLTDGESGDILNALGFNDKCIHVYGDLGGATVTIKGGNVEAGASLATLKDFDGADLSFTVADVNSVRDNVGYLRPVVVGGTDADIYVALVME